LQENRDWQRRVLLAQIKAGRPDVLFFMAINKLDVALAEAARPYVRWIVAQHGSENAPIFDSAVKATDLVVSSLPNIVANVRAAGGRAEYFRLAFEPAILDKLSTPEKLYDITHIGGYSAIHNERNALLEQLASQMPVDFWGYGEQHLRPDSPIRARFHGAAWGLAMYRIRQSSRVVVSKHITAVAQQWANIMTLYEATGVGSLLVIDERKDLNRIFEPGKEVVTYRDAPECVEKVRYYLTHEDERQVIAQAGQRRTLGEHTYSHRMQELVDILNRYLPKVERTILN
jgi:hypothetical protein